MRGGGERVEVGHGDPHDSALLLSVLSAHASEQREGGQATGVAAARWPASWMTPFAHRLV